MASNFYAFLNLERELWLDQKFFYFQYWTYICIYIEITSKLILENNSF